MRGQIIKNLLITSLEEARFLVMIERENCSPDLKSALVNAGIFYCYIDDFYSGTNDDIKYSTLFREMYRYIDDKVQLNINDMLTEALRTNRIEMYHDERKQFMEQYIKTLEMRIDDNGDVILEFKRR